MNGLFNINGGELVVILLVIALVVGPERLPEYSRQLASFARGVRDQVRRVRERVDEEVTAELGDVDWDALDPRRYDPRRIVRDALLEDDGRPGGAARPGGPGPGATRGATPRAVRVGAAGAGGGTAAGTAAGGAAGLGPAPVTDVAASGEELPAPFDDEAT